MLQDPAADHVELSCASCLANGGSQCVVDLRHVNGEKREGDHAYYGGMLPALIAELAETVQSVDGGDEDEWDQFCLIVE